MWRREGMGDIHVVMVAVEHEGFTREEHRDDLQGLGEAGDANRWRVERCAVRFVVRFQPPCAESEFDPATGELVKGGDLAGEPDRVVEVVGEDVRTNPQRGCRQRGRRHSGERTCCSHRWMIANRENGIAEVLDAASVFWPSLEIRRQLRRPDAESERPHARAVYGVDSSRGRVCG